MTARPTRPQGEVSFAGVTYLNGGHQVVPEILRQMRQASAELAWAAEWTPAQLTAMQAQLTPAFSREGLVTQAGVLFQPGGLTREYWRPARSGWEVMTVTVAATHEAEPTSTGRVAEATLEVMPSAFAAQSTDDTVGPALHVTSRLDARRAP